MASFRQTTSRDDDPQVHTHAVISAKVQTEDGRWWALDARYLKRHQRMLGGLYQSVLRAELTHRFGVGWEPIVNGQAEIAGVPRGAARAVLEAHRRGRPGARPSSWPSSGDRQGRDPDPVRAGGAGAGSGQGHPRRKKSGTVPPIWRHGGGPKPKPSAGPPSVLTDAIDHSRPGAGGPARSRSGDGRGGRRVAVGEGVDVVSGRRAAGDLRRAAPRVGDAGAAAGWPCWSGPPTGWSSSCVDLDPPDATAPAVLGWAVGVDRTDRAGLDQRGGAGRRRGDRRLGDGRPSPPTRSRRPRWTSSGLDVFQADAAAAVAGNDELVLAVGPAGAGKTGDARPRAARISHRPRPRRCSGSPPPPRRHGCWSETPGWLADTVAKLLHEWSRPDRPPDSPGTGCRPATTVIVDEAGMIGTADLRRLVTLAEQQRVAAGAGR